jgi:cation diffusion facilitator CzcD-associated flavoprotein CzcO
MIARTAANDCEALVIGAGPYGLSVAAHLRAAGVETRVFGEPMAFWRKNMPKGMKLRSPRGATDLSDPAGAFSLRAYAARHEIAGAGPLPLEDFLGYAAWFEAQAVPEIDQRAILRLEAVPGGFRAVAADGEAIFARRVVVAAGLGGQQLRPAAFADAPAGRVTHSCDHDDFAPLRGKRVAVVGRGQSACETAALLSEAGAEAEILCRGPIRWLGADAPATALRRAVPRRLAALAAAPSAVGPFPLNWIVEAPGLVHWAPEQARAALNAASLGAAAAGWLRPRFAGVRVTSGVEITGCAEKAGAVEVRFARGAIACDHVILATGYRIDIGRTGILAPDLLAGLARREGSPILAAGFESSAPGLHFVGASAVASYGPLLRFIAGAGFAARETTRAIAAGRRAGADRLGYDLAG